MHVYLHLLFLFSGVLFTLAGLAWGYRGVSRCMQTLFIFLAAESLTCFAYGMNLTASTLEAKMLWNHLEYLFGLAVAPLMPILALQLTGYAQRLPKRAMAALFVVPVLGLVLNWTSRWHGLYYARVWLEPHGNVLVLAKERGVLYPLVFLYVYGLIVAAGAIFAWRSTSNRGANREQAALLWVAMLAPLVCGTPYYWLHLEGLQGVNTTHVGFFLTALAFTAALFRDRLQSLIRALTESEELNRILMGHANAIFYTITPDGRFTYVSDSWQTFLGYRSGEMVGRMYRDVVFQEDIPACDAFLENVVRTGELQSGIEYRVRHKDGSMHWHTSSIKPVLDRGGRALTFVGVAHDITAVKRTQEELRLANENLSRLIATREAELKAAVAAALDASAGEARRIGQEIHDGVCQELVGLLRMAEGLVVRCEGAKEARHRAVALAEQAADVLRLARGISYDLTLHDLESLTLCEALAVFARRFESASGVAIELNCSQACAAFAPAAAEHAYRVVREAVVNAIRHGKAMHIWIDVVHEAEQLVLSVTNDGLPVPPDGAYMSGIGMRQMRMRAAQLGGSFSLRTNTQGKTIAELAVPQGVGEKGL
jgi:PAS domain S-box-containing protein